MSLSKQSRRGLFLWVLLALALVAMLAVPLSAFAAEVEPEAAAEPSMVDAYKYIAAAIAMAVSALSAGYAQAKIGAAAAGTLAESTDAAAMLLVLQALPEIIVLLGFVSALIIVGG